jgi:hypothetical protein
VGFCSELENPNSIFKEKAHVIELLPPDPCFTSPSELFSPEGEFSDLASNSQIIFCLGLGMPTHTHTHPELPVEPSKPVNAYLNKILGLGNLSQIQRRENWV